MLTSWVRPKQVPDDEIEVFGLGEPDADDDTGEVLGGRYELLEVLACGATATVYRANDLTTRSMVAVKVLYKSALATVGEFFNQEARLAARIRSPHLVHASDFGEDHGRPYIVFGLVPGSPLAELYCDELMPWRELCVVVLDLLAALDELHRRGITHRDVKPDNVFVLRTLGEHVHVTLLDLGFAAVPPERRITGAPEPSRKVFGTFGFIAPELLAGALPEPRCDLYSVGALMYKMLTGQPVPDLRAAPALICVPSPRMFVPTLPEAVDALVMRALSDVEARFQSAGEMAVAVRGVIAAGDDAARHEVPMQARATPGPTDAAATPPVVPVDEVLRPFRAATSMAVASSEADARPGDPAPPASPAQSTRTPGHIKTGHRARSRLAAVALGSGLLGAAMTWGLTAGHTPQEQSTAPKMTFAVVPSASSGTPPPEPTSLPTPSTASPPTSAAPTSAAASSSSSTASPAHAPSLPETTAVVTSIQQPSPAKKSPLRAKTFAQVMLRLEPEIRGCARRSDLPESPTTVQIRSDPGSGAIDSVRVLRMSSQHPFAVCAAEIVRGATLPPSVGPVEDFTFFKPRGPAAK
jgi:serine/threonine-protein kinase